MTKASRLLIRSAYVAALGGFLFGFDTAVISGAEKSIQEFWNLSGFWHGFTVAIALVGTVIGALTAGKPADRFGRRNALLAVGALYLISALGSALSNLWIPFMIYRFIGGLGVGASSVIGPMYIAEIAPPERRGKLVAMFQFNVVTGILVAYISNYIISLLAQTDAWRWMFGVEVIPAILFFGFLFGVPATPRWLILKGKSDKARDILKLFDISNIEKQVKIIEDSIYAERHVQSPRLFTKQLRVPVMLAILVAFFNQFSGINAIMYYAPRIFEVAGVARESALLQSVSIGLTNMIFTLIAINIIDRVGRKKLLLIGAAGLTVTLLMVTLDFLLAAEPGSVVLIGLIGFIAFFALSQGTVIWVYISEIFPNRVRAKGQTLGSFTHWAGAAIVSWIFPMFAEIGNTTSTGYAFLLFTVIMVIQFIVVYKFFPETKGKSLEQIQDDFGL
ncbi:MAG: sugar porter family MFS transporter [Bacteroidales bacterium]|nr:sugar porter family MFS transporter [Bacteroidales bacterium]MBS3774974.1 sugar porter family MFS transporter [Bacteroidales bacterium]